MKKKLLIVVVSIIATSLIVGTIAYANNIFKKEKEPQIGSISHDYIEKYLDENNKTKQNTSSVLYEENEIVCDSDFHRLGHDAGYVKNATFNPFSFERITQLFPNPVTQSMDGYNYIFYDTDKGSRLYLYFPEEGLFMNGYPVVMKETLSYEQFSDIAIGDSINKVLEVDSVINLYTACFDEVSTEDIERVIDEESIYPTSIHLLSDGILKYEYKRIDKTSDGYDYEIVSIEYDKDFILEGHNGKTCYAIKLDDYKSAE